MVQNKNHISVIVVTPRGPLELWNSLNHFRCNRTLHEVV